MFAWRNFPSLVNGERVAAAPQKSSWRLGSWTPPTFTRTSSFSLRPLLHLPPFVRTPNWGCPRARVHRRSRGAHGALALSCGGRQPRALRQRRRNTRRSGVEAVAASGPASVRRSLLLKSPCSPQSPPAARFCRPNPFRFCPSPVFLRYPQPRSQTLPEHLCEPT